MMLLFLLRWLKLIIFTDYVYKIVYFFFLIIRLLLIIIYFIHHLGVREWIYWTVFLRIIWVILKSTVTLNIIFSFRTLKFIIISFRSRWVIHSFLIKNIKFYLKIIKVLKILVYVLSKNTVSFYYFFYSYFYLKASSRGCYTAL